VAGRKAARPTRRPARATKTVITLPAAKPRNPLSLAGRQRAAGPHGPTRKAERQAAKIRLKKGQEQA